VYNRVVFEAIVTYHDKSTYETGMMKVGIDKTTFLKYNFFQALGNQLKYH